MKLSTLFAGALLPLGLMAAPSAQMEEIGTFDQHAPSPPVPRGDNAMPVAPEVGNLDNHAPAPPVVPRDDHATSLPEDDSEDEESEDFSENPAHPDVVARGIVRPQWCEIVGGSTYVNCRRNARTSSHVVARLRKGSQYRYWCVKTGQCVTIKGKTNW